MSAHEDWAARIGGFSETIGEISVSAFPFDEFDSDEDRLVDALREHGMTPELARKVIAWAEATEATNVLAASRKAARETARSVEARAAAVVRTAIERICAARTPRSALLIAHAIRIAFDFRATEEDSVRSTAKKISVTPWGLKLAANRIREGFGLEGKTSFDKSDDAIARYRETNGRGRKRSRAGDWQRVLPEPSNGGGATRVIPPKA